LAGLPGTRAELRQLKDARGLAAILSGGNEYILIADTGNGRITVWDDATGYVTHWELSGSRPAAVAADPSQDGSFFAIDRRSDRKSMLYRFKFDGKSLSIQPGYPVPVDTGDASDTAEMGIAAAKDQSGDTVLAITDAERGRVLEMKESSTGWQVTATYTKAVGTYAGDEQIRRPTDVAYVTKDGKVELFAADNGNRVVKLR
jgi:DNA-binding beta-propeller fold protein YncE